MPQEQLVMMSKKRGGDTICRQWTVGGRVTVTTEWARLIYGWSDNGKEIKIDLL